MPAAAAGVEKPSRAAPDVAAAPVSAADSEVDASAARTPAPPVTAAPTAVAGLGKPSRAAPDVAAAPVSPAGSEVAASVPETAASLVTAVPTAAAGLGIPSLAAPDVTPAPVSAAASGPAGSSRVSSTTGRTSVATGARATIARIKAASPGAGKVTVRTAESPRWPLINPLTAALPALPCRRITVPRFSGGRDWPAPASAESLTPPASAGAAPVGAGAAGSACCSRSPASATGRRYMSTTSTDRAGRATTWATLWP